MPFPAVAFPADDPFEAETDPQLRTLTRTHIESDDVPWLMVSFTEIRRMPLDQRHGFVVSLIDGRVDVAAIVDMSGMSHDGVVRILDDLVVRGVVVMR